ncbi:MAG: phosphate:Na+ symporter, partial [Flavobacteriales bacterium]
VFSIPLFAVGVPMIFIGRGKVKYWGEFILGFSILFLGLQYLKEAVPDLKGNTDALNFLTSFTEWGFLSRVFFVLVGTVVTVVVQSSSAAMAITLTMCAQGWLPFDVAAAMILGENIGTTITAQFAALVGNTNAKRAANIHTIFNLFGVVWMVVVLPYFLIGLSAFVQNVFGIEDPFTSAADMPIALSAFHTAFNIINVLVLLPFIPMLVKFATKLVKETSDGDDESLKFISGVAMLTPELATIELQKEAAHFGTVTSRMSEFMGTLLNSTEGKEQRKMLKKLKKYEKITDDMEIEITEYITKLADKEITPKTSLRLRSVLNIANDLERIGDIYFQISKTLERKIDEKIYFLPEQRENLNKMIALVDEAFTEMISNLDTPSYDDVTKDKAREIEKKVNKLRDELRSANLKKLGGPGYNVEAAMIYNNLFSSLERIGDHIVNVSESVVGEI